MYNKLEIGIYGLFALIGLMFESILRNFLHLFGFLKTNNSNNTFSKDTIRENLVNQIAIVTGSNTGIGKATALALASYGATVILACRDDQKGKEAANQINLQLKLFSSQEYPFALKGKAKFMKLDLSDLHSILPFVRGFKEEYPRLDLLINNAGLNVDRMLSNGLQQLFQINYLGHYVLYRAVEDLLRSTSGLLLPLSSLNNSNPSSTVPAARVINLSSVMHHTGQGNFKISSCRKFPSLMRYVGFSYYDDSKFYMNLLTMEINRRNDAFKNDRVNSPPTTNSRGSGKFSNEPRDIIAISVNPGAVASDIWRNVPLLSIFNFFTSFVFLSVHEGAKTSIYAALLQETILRSYRENENYSSSEKGGKSIFYKDVPYLIPYHSYWSSIQFELLGYSVPTPEFAGTSFPQHENRFYESSIEKLYQVQFSSPQELSKELWNYSSELALKLLLHSGVSRERLQFLLK